MLSAIVLLIRLASECRRESSCLPPATRSTAVWPTSPESALAAGQGKKNRGLGALGSLAARTQYLIQPKAPQSNPPIALPEAPWVLHFYYARIRFSKRLPNPVSVLVCFAYLE